MPSRTRVSLSKLSLRSLVVVFLSAHLACAAADKPRLTPLHLEPGDVIATGNEWVSLPDIRASDGALATLNVLSMKHRGLLQVSGANGAPVLTPSFLADGKPVAFHNPGWSLVEYWTPVASQVVDGLELSLTWCAPPDSRAAFLRLGMTNHRDHAVSGRLAVEASWGALSRVTYTPVLLRGERTAGLAPWVADGEVFSFSTVDTDFAWSLLHPGSDGLLSLPPTVFAPTLQAGRTATLEPGQSMEAIYILGAGTEEFSAPHNAKALREHLDREGPDALIAQTAAWCARRTRSTGDPQLDLLMNRNLLFTRLYAWGRTIDSEQLVGVTSRSPRYYVSAAYWDRDAMLWSFPALLDSDPVFARDALEYALTAQLRNAGTHSRFIDGTVLEDGFQLDEAAAPVIALAAYLDRTGDLSFLHTHREALLTLRDRLLAHFDPAAGLFTSMQDSQDEFAKRPFLTYANVLTWRALLDLAQRFEQLNDLASAHDLTRRATALRTAILEHCVASGATGADGPIFAAATDGSAPLFVEIPPGSLMRLPALGFVAESDPVFQRTYAWLHSPNHRYSYGDKPFGLPGSYRVDFTTSWAVADHLLLKAGREKALRILRESPWDGGIVTEGLSPSTGLLDTNGRAFATAAGYVSHTICQVYCTDHR